MDPRPKSLALPITITAIISAIIFGAGGYYVGTDMMTTSPYIPPPYVPKDNEPTATKAREEASRYRPPAGTMCAAVMTTAIHKATGAVYTFPSACIPPGWAK